MTMKSVIGAAALVMLSSTAYGAEGKCACVTDAASSISLTQVDGAVTLTGAKGYSVAKIGSTLADGSTLMTGKDGSAKIAAGNCAMTVNAKMSVSVSSKEGQMCLSTAQAFGNTEQVYGADLDPALIPADGPAAAGGYNYNTLIGVGTIVAVGGGLFIYAATKDDDNPVSQ